MEENIKEEKNQITPYQSREWEGSVTVSPSEKEAIAELKEEERADNNKLKH